ncbi:hypothetical protein BYT27DRAFT_7217439 [Phlegmacium glaucopus]|nr:hypothetical protein BYT27DRAFT_7217439 [Phlegmacium glaucopus]
MARLEIGLNHNSDLSLDLGLGAPALSTTRQRPQPQQKMGLSRPDLGVCFGTILDYDPTGIYTWAINSVLASINQPQLRPFPWPRLGGTGIECCSAEMTTSAEDRPQRTGPGSLGLIKTTRDEQSISMGICVLDNFARGIPVRISATTEENEVLKIYASKSPPPSPTVNLGYGMMLAFGRAGGKMYPQELHKDLGHVNTTSVTHWHWPGSRSQLNIIGPETFIGDGLGHPSACAGT